MKKTAVAVVAIAMLAAGSTSALAQRGGGGGGGGGNGGHERVTICHRTNSEANPWNELTLSEQGAERHLENHPEDFVVDEDNPCPPEDDDDGDDNDNRPDRNVRKCSVRQENNSHNSTGDTTQGGLINLNNIALQGNNIDLLGNVLCQADFLNHIVVAVLGVAIGDADGHHDHDGDHGHDRDHDGKDHRGHGGLLGGLLGDDGALSVLGILF